MITQIFDTIVADLQAGNYTRLSIREHTFWEFTSAPITDEAELFEEASKTLLYLYCRRVEDHRYELYYNHVLIPDTEIHLSDDVTYHEILEAVSADALETMDNYKEEIWI